MVIGVMGNRDGELKAYLEFKADGADLKTNYLEIMVTKQGKNRANVIQAFVAIFLLFL